jgi:hypothetical protein
MRTDQVFSSYIKREDVPEGTKGLNLTVVGVRKDWIITQEEGEIPKWMLDVKEIDRPLVLGKTNAGQLAELFGDKEMNNWAGKTFNLYVDENVEFMGKKVGGLRIRASQ